MDPNALALLEELIETPSPSGYESPLQKVVRSYAGGIGTQSYSLGYIKTSPDATTGDQG